MRELRELVRDVFTEPTHCEKSRWFDMKNIERVLEGGLLIGESERRELVEALIRAGADRADAIIPRIDAHDGHPTLVDIALDMREHATTAACRRFIGEASKIMKGGAMLSRAARERIVAELIAAGCETADAIVPETRIDWAPRVLNLTHEPTTLEQEDLGVFSPRCPKTRQTIKALLTFEENERAPREDEVRRRCEQLAKIAREQIASPTSQSVLIDGPSWITALLANALKAEKLEPVCEIARNVPRTPPTMSKTERDMRELRELVRDVFTEPTHCEKSRWFDMKNAELVFEGGLLIGESERRRLVEALIQAGADRADAIIPRIDAHDGHPTLVDIALDMREHATTAACRRFIGEASNVMKGGAMLTRAAREQIVAELIAAGCETADAIVPETRIDWAPHVLNLTREPTTLEQEDLGVFSPQCPETRKTIKTLLTFEGTPQEDEVRRRCEQLVRIAREQIASPTNQSVLIDGPPWITALLANMLKAEKLEPVCELARTVLITGHDDCITEERKVTGLTKVYT